MNDNLGDRMKSFESHFAGVRFLPLLPVVARLDGKNFSTFTKGLKRPYDERLTGLMIDTTAHLVEETNAVCGYTQSDEITLAWYSSSVDSQIYFDGRVQKMTSVLAATCTAYFNARLAQVIPEKAGKLPVFDCRVWQLPTFDEAANVFVWRELDATKNAITMAAQEFYSHKELHEKNGSEKQEMLYVKGVNFNDYPPFFRRGTYVQRRKISGKISGKFTAEDLEALPPKHHARTNPDLVVERTEYRRLEMPPILKVTNRVGVIFRGEEPVTVTESTTCDTASKSTQVD